jgi:hypothetical protein
MQIEGDGTQQPDLSASRHAPLGECEGALGRTESSSNNSTNTSSAVHTEPQKTPNTVDGVSSDESAAAEEPSRVPVSLVEKETVEGLPRGIHCWVSSAGSVVTETNRTNEPFVWTHSGAGSVNQNKRPRDDKTRVRDEVVKKACEVRMTFSTIPTHLA